MFPLLAILAAIGKGAATVAAGAGKAVGAAAAGAGKAIGSAASGAGGALGNIGQGVVQAAGAGGNVLSRVGQGVGQAAGQTAGAGGRALSGVGKALKGGGKALDKIGEPAAPRVQPGATAPVASASPRPAWQNIAQQFTGWDQTKSPAQNITQMISSRMGGGGGGGGTQDQGEGVSAMPAADSRMAMLGRGGGRVGQTAPSVAARSGGALAGIGRGLSSIGKGVQGVSDWYRDTNTPLDLIPPLANWKHGMQSTNVFNMRQDFAMLNELPKGTQAWFTQVGEMARKYGWDKLSQFNRQPASQQERDEYLMTPGQQIQQDYYRSRIGLNQQMKPKDWLKARTDLDGTRPWTDNHPYDPNNPDHVGWQERSDWLDKQKPENGPPVSASAFLPAGRQGGNQGPGVPGPVVQTPQGPERQTGPSWLNRMLSSGPGKKTSGPWAPGGSLPSQVNVGLPQQAPVLPDNVATVDNADRIAASQTGSKKALRIPGTDIPGSIKEIIAQQSPKDQQQLLNWYRQLGEAEFLKMVQQFNKPQGEF